MTYTNWDKARGTRRRPLKSHVNKNDQVITVLVPADYHFFTEHSETEHNRGMYTERR